MTSEEKALQYFVIAIPENEEQANAYFYARKYLNAAIQSALPSNPLSLEQLRKVPHGKIKDSTLQSICDRANEVAQPPAHIDQGKVWPGCEACKNASLAIGEVQFYGAFEGSIDVSGNIHYCPNCGRPITPVAKERQVERLEALKDGNQTH